MRRTGEVLLVVVGCYFVLRAVVEPFTIDVTNPATYEQDWGGPHLVGVLAVHCLPGVICAVLLVRFLWRRREVRS